MLRQSCSVIVLAGVLSVAHGDEWHDTIAPHFVIHRQHVFGAAGLSLNLEKIHNRLRMDLAVFSPWMEKERINLYLYGDAASYQKGEFHPPAWSNGLAYYDRRTIVVYDQPDAKKLYQVIAHEMTHLLFESYWGEAHKEPPHWLNEGLAMMEETDQGDGKSSEWFRSMVYLGPGRMPPLSQVLDIIPDADLTNKEAAGLWYVEAYSLVHFLYRQHSRLQFRNFCELLRSGRSSQEALWTAYRLATIPKFETAWRTWVREVSLRNAGRLPGLAAPRPNPVDSGRGFSPTLPRFRPMRFDFQNVPFQNLRDEN